MPLEPSLEEQELLADTFTRAAAPLSARERLIETVVGAGFVAAVAVVWSVRPPHSFALVPAMVCVLVLTLATLVRFDTPFGSTVPTQLAFIPLLFAVPVAVLPLGVVLALWIPRLYEILARGASPAKLLKSVGNAWFAIGPAAVFAASATEPSHASVAILVAALLAQFAVDFAVSTLRYGISRAATISEQLRELWVYAIDAGLSGIGLVVAEDVKATPASVLALLPLLALFALFAHERRRRLEGMLELGSAYRGTALVLGDVVEADDGYTGEHCKSVVALALAVGEELGLDARRTRNLEFGALLHDVGKIAIPKEIINKPGKLDPAEWTVIKTHTLEGQKLLERVGGFMRDVGLIVRSHHERWDGGGYPDGLAGEAIPIEARIVACCDGWNAMRTDRVYRKALSHEAALAELNANAGTQFDPHCVAALVRVIERPRIEARGAARSGPPGLSAEDSRAAA